MSRKNPKNMTPEERVDKLRRTKVNCGRHECEPIQTGDMTASLTLAIDSLKRYGGMPYKYPPTQEGLELFGQRSQDFFDYVARLNSNPEIEKKLILDVEAWCVYLGISRKTLFEYDKRGGAWSEYIQYVKNVINESKKQLALNYKIPPVLYMFDAANNHDYANTSEFKIQNNMILTRNDNGTFERDMISSGLTWNEDTNSFEAIETKGEIIDVDLRSEDPSNKIDSTEEGRESGTENVL